MPVRNIPDGGRDARAVFVVSIASGDAGAVDATLARFEALHPKRIDLSLARIERLLSRLDHPERRLPPVIHVAGTNGKGSLIAYLRAILEAAGFRVHAYISPHLVRFNERMRLAGTLIADDALLRVLDRVERANRDDPITFFEATTAAAFLAFAETPADVTLLETGLGGRLDATNVVARPAVSAITPVGLDHMEFLGTTLAAIAGEKAGILKAGVPAVIGPQDQAAADVLADRAAAVGAPLFRHGAEWDVARESDVLVWRGLGQTLALPLPALFGVHQIANAGMAVAVIRKLGGFRVSDEALAAGLGRAVWPARLQRLRGTAINALLPKAAELWLDGGHNPAAAEVLVQSLREIERREGGAAPLHLVVAMKDNKDLEGFLRPFAGFVASVTGVSIPDDPRCFGPDAIAAAAAKLGISSRPAPSVKAALRALVVSAGPALPFRVLIAGSLYLAGSVLKDMNTQAADGG